MNYSGLVYCGFLLFGLIYCVVKFGKVGLCFVLIWFISFKLSKVQIQNVCEKTRKRCVPFFLSVSAVSHGVITPLSVGIKDL